jgi:hypothetical protein
LLTNRSSTILKLTRLYIKILIAKHGLKVLINEIRVLKGFIGKIGIFNFLKLFLSINNVLNT